VFEAFLIIVLLGLSFITLLSFSKRFRAFQQAAHQACQEKSRLDARLLDAFKYIGKVNVELHEIESALCGIAFYPRSKREFRQLLDGLTTRAMTIAGAPWLVVRMIDQCSGKTVHEHAVQRPRGGLPAATLGNRAVLDDCPAAGLQTIVSRRRNLDLLTVFILPQDVRSEGVKVLLNVILSQIEMLFILHRAGGIKPLSGGKKNTKEIDHDSDD
jgi:hypothetical protein